MPTRSRRARAVAAAVATLLAVTAGGCAGAEGLRRREGPTYDAETHGWMHLLQRHGGDGMWVVVRGYHRGDDVVAVASNAELSHAAVLDVGNLEVIEAIGDGVRVTKLIRLLRESHRLQLVRPEGWTPEVGAQALARARSQVGKGYDFGGVVGAPDKERWYCSELAAWSMGVAVDRLFAWNVLHPKDLHRKGRLLFDSGPRDGVVDAVPAATLDEAARQSP